MRLALMSCSFEGAATPTAVAPVNATVGDTPMAPVRHTNSLRWWKSGSAVRPRRCSEEEAAPNITELEWDNPDVDVDYSDS